MDEPRWCSRIVDQRVYWLLAFFVCAAAGGLRLAWLLSSPVAFGRDGYYYALQVNSLAHGDLAVPTIGFVPFLLMLLARMLVDSDVLAVKLVAVFASTLLTVGVALFGHAVTRRSEAALLSALAAASASLHNLFIVEFVSNLIGMTFFVWCLVFVVRMKTAGSSRTGWLGVLAAVAATGAVFSHGSAGVALLIAGIGWLTIAVVHRRVIRHELVAMAVLAALLGGLFATGNLINVTAAVSRLPSINLWSHMSGSYSLLLWASALWAVALLARTGTDQGPQEKAAFNAVLPVLVVGILYAANPFFIYEYTPQNVVDRLALWGWLIAALVVPALAFVPRKLTPVSVGLGGVMITTLLLAGTSRGIPLGADPRFLEARSQLLRTLELVPAPTVESKAIVAGHGDQFVVSYVTGATASSRRPSNPRKEVWWLLKTWRRNPVWPDGAVVAGHYGFVAEHRLSDWLVALTPDEKKEIASANPLHLGREVIRVMTRKPAVSPEKAMPAGY
jgi:hypothetical protein